MRTCGRTPPTGRPLQVVLMVKSKPRRQRPHRSPSFPGGKRSLSSNPSLTRPPPLRLRASLRPAIRGGRGDRARGPGDSECSPWAAASRRGLEHGRLEAMFWPSFRLSSRAASGCRSAIRCLLFRARADPSALTRPATTDCADCAFNMIQVETRGFASAAFHSGRGALPQHHSISPAAGPADKNPCAGSSSGVLPSGLGWLGRDAAPPPPSPPGQRIPEFLPPAGGDVGGWTGRTGRCFLG